MSEELQFGRYTYDRAYLLQEARDMGKPDVVIRLLEVVPLGDLAAAAGAEITLNGIDDAFGWDETSALMAAASWLAMADGVDSPG